MPDRPVLIVGAGGHAKVVIELLRAMSIPIAGLIDHDRTKQALGVAWVGADEDLPRLRAEGLNRAFVAVGDNRRRLDLGRGLVAGGFELVNAVSSHAVISPSVRRPNCTLPGWMPTRPGLSACGSIIGAPTR